MRFVGLKQLTVMCALASVATLAAAQNFPSKPITIYCPVPPGGPIDWLGRAVGAKLQERWGQPAIVENRPGAGGWLAAQAMQKAAPDGHSLLVFTQVLAYGMSLFIKGVDFQPGDNAQALTAVFSHPYVLAVNTALPVKNVRELIAYSKANPGKLNWGAFPKSDHWLHTYRFIRQNGLDIEIVPYQGGAAMQRALLANETQIQYIPPFGMDALVKSGKVLPLAVTSLKRWSRLPDLPSVEEASGFNMDANIQYGFFTTFGTPRPIVDKLANEIADIASSPEVRGQIISQGFEPVLIKPDEWTSSMRAEAARARGVVDAAGIKPE